MTTGADDPISARAREIAALELGRLVDSTPVSHALYQRALKSMPLGVGSSFQIGDDASSQVRMSDTGVQGAGCDAGERGGGELGAVQAGRIGGELH